MKEIRPVQKPSAFESDDKKKKEPIYLVSGSNFAVRYIGHDKKLSMEYKDAIDLLYGDGQMWVLLD